jgi:phenylpyruvate tautomerase PptA (4-oxalocrotonate tautomerase family)
MPTYTCFTSQGKLKPEQKKELAGWLATVYREVFGLQRYMTQVIFHELAKDDRYIGGHPAPSDVGWIRCDVREGRSEEQKAKLLHRIQEGVAKIANVSGESVWIYFDDLPPMNIMEWGHIMPHLKAMPAFPDNDSAWFDGLSEPYKERLRTLA